MITLVQFFLLITIGYQSLQAQSWVWHYKQYFPKSERAKVVGQSAVHFGKNDVPQFNQLIFSWNAFRPMQGHFNFFVQVRDAITKKWHDWHKMAEWGIHVQRSFFSELVTGSAFHHVRLELPTSKCADAFKIKIESSNGACMGNLHGLYVSLANYSLFKSEVGSAQIKKLQTVSIDGVPRYSQMALDHPKKEVICSPTSCSMVTSFCSGSLVNPIEFAAHAFDAGLGAYGSWPFNTAHGFEKLSGKSAFYVKRFNSFCDLYKFLQHKIPVVVSVRGQIAGAPLEYNKGHLLVVVGFDQENKKIRCHDPAFPTDHETCVSYPLNSFLEAWERSRRLAYVMEPLKNDE